MQEGVLSLMQMAKISAALARLRRRPAALHLDPDRSDDRRRHRLVRHARRPQHRRAGRADRLRRPARHRADDPPEAARGLPAQRVPARARHARHGRPAPRAEGHRRALPAAPATARLAAGLRGVPRSAAPRPCSAASSTSASGSASSASARCSPLSAIPHLAVPVVLVAGTNGKGSTAALLAAMCRAAGYRTGLYTSPHLEAVTERLAVDGRVDRRPPPGGLSRSGPGRGLQATSGRRAADLLRGPDRSPPSVYFARRRGRSRGPGGRSRRPARRHQRQRAGALAHHLDRPRPRGASRRTTLAAIAREKAGILRRGPPAIAWTEDPEVERGAPGAAREIGEPSSTLAAGSGADRAVDRRRTPCPQRVRLETGARRLRPRAPPGRAAPARQPRPRRPRRRGPGGPRLPAARRRGDPRRRRRAAAGPDAWSGSICPMAGGCCSTPPTTRPAPQPWPTGRAISPSPRTCSSGRWATRRSASMLPPLAAVTGRLFLTRPPGRRAADPRDFRPLVAGREAGDRARSGPGARRRPGRGKRPAPGLRLDLPRRRGPRVAAATVRGAAAAVMREKLMLESPRRGGGDDGRLATATARQDQTGAQDAFTATVFETCYLFGSYARGEANAESDVDVLIVLDEVSPLLRRDRAYQRARLFEVSRL